jgi:hypothetical protein
VDHSSGIGLSTVGRFYHDVPDGRAVYLYTVLKIGIVAGLLNLVGDMVQQRPVRSLCIGLAVNY